MNKRIISFIVCIFMIFPNFAINVKATSFVIADLTNINQIRACSLPASSELTKTGDFTMKWGDSDIYRDITIPISKKDLTGDGYLEMWVYSQAPTKMNFALSLISNNPASECLDYYYAIINVNWTGWKMISLKTGEEGDFKKMHQPAGFNKIDEIRLWPSFGGNSPVYGTNLYFDKIMLNSERSSEASEGGAGDEDNKLIIADFSNAANVTQAGFPSSSEQTLSGSVTLKWSGEKLKSAPKMTLPTNDWTEYGVLEMDVYSEKVTNSDIKVVVVSENPATDGTDYYITSMVIDWTGWKRLTFPIGDYGVFIRSRTPLGWDQVTQFTFWPVFGGVEPDPSTVLYIDKIWLAGTPSGSGFDDSVDFILPSQSKPDDVDAVALIKEKHPNQGHPRLLTSPEDFENMKRLIETDPYMKKTFQNVLNTANTALSVEDTPYGTPDGKRLPRTEANMIPNLALAYKVTGDIKYKERLWRALKVASEWPDWNPSHFLDVGDYARSLAYAYDWLYDEWTEQEKRTIRNALVRNGFRPSMAHLRNKTGFAGQTNNWNQVINAGLGLAALAIGDEPGYEDLCNEVINRTVESLPTGINSFAPDGACPEGPGYWNYAQQTFYQYNNAMFTAMGTDFGLSQIGGLPKTGYFPISMNGPRGSFNFADGGGGITNDAVLLWIGRLYNQPEVATYRVQVATQGGSWADLLMYRPEIILDDYRDKMQLDYLFKGEQNVVSTRSTWFDNNAIFLAYKGGHNQASHGDLDIGSFVLDAQGQRWVCELGSEYYEAEGMWNFSKGGGRWKYYRKRAEGNNTLVINPKPTEDQDPYATAEIYKFETSESATYGLIDMTEAYQEDVDEVKRGFALINNRSMVIVQDEIKNTKPAEIYSFFHTRAEVEISEDDKKTAIMTIGNQKMKVDLISPADGQFKVMDAAPLPTSPHPPQAYDNPGVRKLAVHLTNAINPTISVVFTPLIEGQPEIKLPRLLKLEEWDNFLEGGAYITELTVDGIPVQGFSPYNLYYTLSDGVLGKVEAKANEDVEIEITQATEKGGSAFVHVKRPSTGEENIYTVSFRERIPESLSQYLQTYDIVAVEASDVPEPENIPENTFDKDLSTRWSAEGEQWIRWDLGEAQLVDRVMLAFLNGNARSTIFSLDVSADGIHYEKVFDGMTSGTTLNLETFAFEPRKVRYIQFNGRGNTTNEWNSITEISVPRVSKDFIDTREHWAKEDIIYLESLGFVKGVTEENFAPEETISIAEFITMAVRVSGKEASVYQNELKDVKADDWFAGYIQTALNEGYIPEEMLKENTIRPNEAITREEICGIAVKIYESQTGLKPKTYGLSRFVDQNEVSDYAKEYVDKGLTLRLIKGMDENHLAPKATASRAQASVIVKRLFLQIGI